MCADRLNAQPNLVRESTPEEHVNESPLNLQTTYRYDTSAGINQNIYVVDTGVRKDHVDLPGVQWLAQFYGSGEIDDHGHGWFSFLLSAKYQEHTLQELLEVIHTAYYQTDRFTQSK